MKAGRSFRGLVLVLALALIVGVAGGATFAWLTAKTDPVVNTFTPAHVTCQVDETFDGTTKSDVKVKNAGDIPAYIRAYIVVTWKDADDADDNVYGELPVEGTDYTMEIPTNTDWVQGSDGYYYYTRPVAVGDSTGTLISECKLTEKVVKPVGYDLSVEIIAEAIQSVPTTTVVGVWGPVASVASNGTLTVN